MNWKWFFRLNPNMLWSGLLGGFGEKAKEDAEEVADEQADVMLLLIAVAVVVAGVYFGLKAIGVID